MLYVLFVMCSLCATVLPQDFILNSSSLLGKDSCSVVKLPQVATTCGTFLSQGVIAMAKISSRCFFFTVQGVQGSIVLI